VFAIAKRQRSSSAGSFTDGGTVERSRSYLAGEATHLSAMRRGTIGVAVGNLSFLVVGLAMIFGVCVECFALFKPEGASS